MKKTIILISICIGVYYVDCLFAHSGGTDRYGGHVDHSTGEYHFHNLKDHVNSVDSKDEKIKFRDEKSDGSKFDFYYYRYFMENDNASDAEKEYLRGRRVIAFYMSPVINSKTFDNNYFKDKDKFIIKKRYTTSFHNEEVPTSDTSEAATSDVLIPIAFNITGDEEYLLNRVFRDNLKDIPNVIISDTPFWTIIVSCAKVKLSTDYAVSVNVIKNYSFKDIIDLNNIKKSYTDDSIFLREYPILEGTWLFTTFELEKTCKEIVELFDKNFLEPLRH